MWASRVLSNIQSLFSDGAGDDGAVWFRSCWTVLYMKLVVGSQLHRLSCPQRNHPKLLATHHRTWKIMLWQPALDVDTMPPLASCHFLVSQMQNHRVLFIQYFQLAKFAFNLFGRWSPLLGHEPRLPFVWHIHTNIVHYLSPFAMNFWRQSRPNIVNGNVKCQWTGVFIVSAHSPALDIKDYFVLGKFNLMPSLLWQHTNGIFSEVVDWPLQPI